MRTTLDIEDHLYKRAKIFAVEKGVSLKAVVERALTRSLAEEGSGRKSPLPDLPTAGGKGMHPKVRIHMNSAAFAEPKRTR